jgi:hypothetical protein
MIEFLKRYGWCIWLGFSMGIADIGVTNWKWWVIVIPIIILVGIYGELRKNENNKNK